MTIVWFRRDLRLADNAALSAAAAAGPVLPVFIWSPGEERPWEPGAASRWWLHHSLESLRRDLGGLGLPLIIRRGPAAETLCDLVRETGATAIFWNKIYEPAILSLDSSVKKAVVENAGVEARSFAGEMLHEPWSVLTKDDRPYQVFTPFWRAWQAKGEPERPVPVPPTTEKIPARKSEPLTTLRIEELGLLPRIDWAAGLRAASQPGEAGARSALAGFAGRVAAYATERDRPDHEGTSRLSPHLHFGEITPRQIWHAAATAAGTQAEPYLRQIAWRDFARQLLVHFPHTDARPLRPEFRDFPWAQDRESLAAWQKGRTGFPIVDAGMKELWTTGWMHNRVRMVVASFLVKDLLIPWQDGAKWFWDTLVDADLANNAFGWQWSAGCGADAAPYFRIFNPSSQSAKFDPAGDYIRRWLPELKSWPVKWLHEPSLASDAVRRAARYPAPIVDHAAARKRALDAFKELRSVRTQFREGALFPMRRG